MRQIASKAAEAGRLLRHRRWPTGRRRGRALFERLLADGRLAIGPSALFQSQPPALQGPVTRDRVRGMLLGLAIGDALGNTTESLWFGLRQLCTGEIRSYLPNRRALGRRVGLPSDDTQLAFWTVEQLVEDGRLDVDALARRFSTRPVFGVGHSVRGFRRSMAAVCRGRKLRWGRRETASKIFP